MERLLYVLFLDYPEEGGSKPPKTQVTNYQPRLCHIPEDYNLNFLTLWCQQHIRCIARDQPIMAILVQPCWNFFLTLLNWIIMVLSKILKLVIYTLNFNPSAPELNYSTSEVTVSQ
jgi:hypothetical protein